MEIVNLEEQAYPVKKADKHDVQEFITEQLEEMYKFMQEKKLPFLHCAQVGIDKDMFIWRRATKQPTLVINPSFIVKDKKTVRYTPEASFSHPLPNNKFKIFATIRATKILGVFDEYTSKGELVRNSNMFKDAEAVAFQQMADLSKGKLISRFEVVELTNEKEKVEGSVTEAETAI